MYIPSATNKLLTCGVPPVQLLVRNAFPQIAELCMARGVSFVEVDLRTGVTKEQSSNNEVLYFSLSLSFLFSRSLSLGATSASRRLRTKEQSSNNEVSLCSGREWFRSLGQALVGEAGGHERTVLQQRGRPAKV